MSELPLPPASRRLGGSDITVSPIAWGMWRLAENGRTAREAAALVHAALDAGINFLDTADIYGFDGAGGFGDAELACGSKVEGALDAAVDLGRIKSACTEFKLCCANF